MEREELECFLLLAEELHFGRTAERMRLSRARVSQLVQRLERRVGGRLFDRTSRRVELTALGGQLYADLAPHHRGIRSALDRAVAAARSHSGLLHVGFTTPLAGEHAMRAADVLRVEHPGLRVEICEVPFADPYGPLRRGDFDVQLTDFPAREADVEGGPVLFTETRALALPSQHPLAQREFLDLEDLGDLTLLSLPADTPGHWLDERMPRHTPSGRPVHHGLEVTSLQEALTLVSGGRGALIVAAHTAAYFARPGVTYLPLADAAPFGYGLMWRAGEGGGTVGLFAETARRLARATRDREPLSAAGEIPPKATAATARAR
ncbi:LysR family transcriptional regulator [Streptomyces sp. NA04227]|uniref:LysR family transcriptional regulator n=1 Tax=Streptomyces sp. NA04227 TaxID=2742136 RepID=UPI0015903C82|nr:LysR family transcriptional regulator [Streptomyces sp. NA04227]QKW09873.1 LysR family transcriptional regulator [Streptomyces sp. NA04227]